jgi:hypothetical protein
MHAQHDHCLSQKDGGCSVRCNPKCGGEIMQHYRMRAARCLCQSEAGVAPRGWMTREAGREQKRSQCNVWLAFGQSLDSQVEPRDPMCRIPFNRGANVAADGRNRRRNGRGTQKRNKENDMQRRREKTQRPPHSLKTMQLHGVAICDAMADDRRVCWCRQQAPVAP